MFLAIATIILGQAAFALCVQPPIWPLPAAINVVEGETLTLDQSFKFTTNTGYGSVVENAIQRYSELIAVPSGSTGLLKSCSISIAKQGEVEIINADESYELNVNSEGTCVITSQTVWGALRGMESFTHFLVRNTATNSVDTVNPVISITDAPRFGHRGMLIDTARHYLGVGAIRKVIDALPMSK